VRGKVDEGRRGVTALHRRAVYGRKKCLGNAPVKGRVCKRMGVKYLCAEYDGKRSLRSLASIY
jgi:hypothetical protein